MKLLDSTVLFVDDQEEILLLIKRMLKDEPYHILFAKSGKEALEIIENKEIDVIVTDVIMPNMSGLELLDIVKESNPHIVRIILSGFSQVPTLLSAINNGKIFRYITKPWQVDNEAKSIIQDAIEYAKLLNEKQQDSLIDVEAFCELMDKCGHKYVVTIDNKVVYIHKDLSVQVELNQKFNLSEFTLDKKYIEHKMSNRTKVFIEEN